MSQTDGQNAKVNHLSRLLLEENIQFIQKFGVVHFKKIFH